MWHLTPDTWHLAPDMWHVVGVNILSTFQLSSSYSLGVMMFWRFGGQVSLSDLITRLFVEQPQLHRVCKLMTSVFVEQLRWAVLNSTFYSNS